MIYNTRYILSYGHIHASSILLGVFIDIKSFLIQKIFQFIGGVPP